MTSSEKNIHVCPSTVSINFTLCTTVCTPSERSFSALEIIRRRSSTSVPIEILDGLLVVVTNHNPNSPPLFIHSFIHSLPSPCVCNDNMSSISTPQAAAAAAAAAKTCSVCTKSNATKRCSRCNIVWYCGQECQKKDWKKHKPVCNSEYQSHQYELHKKAFDAIIEKYNLKTEEKSTEIAELLTSGVDTVTAPSFAERFEMDLEEAVVFLEWVKVGVKFKEETVDIAKKSGFGDVAAKR